MTEEPEENFISGIENDDDDITTVNSKNGNILGFKMILFNSRYVDDKSIRITLSNGTWDANKM